jgi:glutaredoxin-related protein
MVVRYKLQSKRFYNLGPSVWVNGKFIGGCDATLRAARETDLLKTIGKKDQGPYSKHFIIQITYELAQ